MAAEALCRLSLIVVALVCMLPAALEATPAEQEAMHYRYLVRPR